MSWMYGEPVSAETAHGDAWAARIRAKHEAAGASCPCGNGGSPRPLCKCEGGEFVHPRHVTVNGGVTGIDHSLPLDGHR